MFDFDPICDCGKKVVDSQWPCKFCGRPDPRHCLNRGHWVALKQRPKPRFPQEISFVFSPYIPTLSADEIVGVQPLAIKEK